MAAAFFKLGIKANNVACRRTSRPAACVNKLGSSRLLLCTLMAVVLNINVSLKEWKNLMFILVALNPSLLSSHRQHDINMSPATLRHFIPFPFSPCSLFNPLPFSHSSPSLTHSLFLSHSSLWVHLVVQHLNTMKQRVVDPWWALVLCLLCSPHTSAANDFFTSIGESHAFSSYPFVASSALVSSSRLSCLIQHKHSSK